MESGEFLHGSVFVYKELHCVRVRFYLFLIHFGSPLTSIYLEGPGLNLEQKYTDLKTLFHYVKL